MEMRVPLENVLFLGSVDLRGLAGSSGTVLMRNDGFDPFGYSSEIQSGLLIPSGGSQTHLHLSGMIKLDVNVDFRIAIIIFSHTDSKHQKSVPVQSTDICFYQDYSSFVASNVLRALRIGS